MDVRMTFEMTTPENFMERLSSPSVQQRAASALEQLTELVHGVFGEDVVLREATLAPRAVSTAHAQEGLDGP